MGMLLALARRAGIVEELYSCTDGSLYLRRIRLSPRTPWGQLRLHQFFRGDQDAHVHDHAGDFLTIPLCRSGYMEEILDKATGERRFRIVPGWLPTFREATYAHRVVGRVWGFSGKTMISERPFFTLIWRWPKHRDWGFLVPVEDAIDKSIIRPGWRPNAMIRWAGDDLLWVQWRSYLRGLYGEQVKLVD